MLSDQVMMNISAGKGGDGAIHFRRVKYIPKGGPDGGDGGRGGDVIICASSGIRDLSEYKNRKKVFAQNGSPGGGSHQSGQAGEDATLKVPIGTKCWKIENSNKKSLVADLRLSSDFFILARGGDGGKGNSGFKNSVRQAPHFAEKGDVGEECDILLEFSFLADVAIVGFPNIGKSTFLSKISNAKPKIGDYPFTTIDPVLGVVEKNKHRLSFVDVPGIISGASKNKGIGLRFLQHIERAKFILYCVDAAANNPLEDLLVVQKEIQKADINESEKKIKCTVITRSDLLKIQDIQNVMHSIEAKLKIPVFAISSQKNQGISDLLSYVFKNIPKHREVRERVEIKMTHESGNKKNIIQKEGKSWRIISEKIEKIIRQTDIHNPEAIERLYDILRREKILSQLRKQGAVFGDEIILGEFRISYRN